MKNLITILIFMTIVILTACSDEEVTNNKYTFIGEGEFWEAEYVYEGTETRDKEDGRTTYSNKYRDVFRLIYKGSTEDIQSIEKLEYSFDTSTGGGSSIREFDEPLNDITFTISGGGTGAKVKKDEIIKVNVKWDYLEESFELTNQEK